MRKSAFVVSALVALGAVPVLISSGGHAQTTSPSLTATAAPRPTAPRPTATATAAPTPTATVAPKATTGRVHVSALRKIEPSTPRPTGLAPADFKMQIQPTAEQVLTPVLQKRPKTIANSCDPAHLKLQWPLQGAA